MKREECKIGTIVRTPSGFVGKIVEDDGTSTLPIKIEWFNSNTVEWWKPEDLTKINTIRTRMFQKGDKVRYVPTEHYDYAVEPDEDKTYEVINDERDSGWVDLKGHGYNNCVKWFDLKLVEPVKEQPYYMNTGGVVKRKGNKVMICFSYSKFGKEKADALAQAVCDKLNEMEG